VTATPALPDHNPDNVLFWFVLQLDPALAALTWEIKGQTHFVTLPELQLMCQYGTHNLLKTGRFGPALEPELQKLATTRPPD